jgi:glycosyltransferase involved in cell wall biosynthesis
MIFTPKQQHQPFWLALMPKTVPESVLFRRLQALHQTVVVLSTLGGARINLRKLLCSRSPRAMLWFGPVGRWSSSRFWWLKRSLLPTVPIFAIRSGKSPTAREKALIRFLVYHQLIDGALCEHTAWSDLSETSTRVFVGNDADAALNWIERRLRARGRSLLLVDPSVTVKSPSMRSLVRSAPLLQRAGWEIDVWCYETDLSPAEVNIVKLPRWGLPFFGLFNFFFLCNLYAWAYFCLTGGKPASVRYTTCANLLSADICAVHFCSREWIKIAKRLGGLSLKDRIQLLIVWLGTFFEAQQYRSKTLKLLLPVSPGIGEAIRRCYGDRIPQKVVPNDYDEERFNPGTRDRFRRQMRSELGFADDQVVFAFTSYGHYRRKGFWHVIGALEILSKEKTTQAQLLVIGGSKSTLACLQRQLDNVFVGWPTMIRFVGVQSEVERYLAAADAFLFPSFFEAAARAPVEAAAMGLPLFITNIYGTENIPKDELNGAWLESDPQDIAAKMRAFIRGEIAPKPVQLPAALTRRQYAECLQRIFEQFSTARSGPMLT